MLINVTPEEVKELLKRDCSPSLQNSIKRDESNSYFNYFDWKYVPDWKPSPDWKYVPHDLDEGELTPFKMLESARNIFSEVHKDWREHIGDPIMDKQAIIGDLLHELARMVETGRLEF